MVDLDGDGKWTFPDDVPTDPTAPGYEERGKISNARDWIIPKSGATLVFGAGHMHPGGMHVDLRVSRDGPDDADRADHSVVFVQDQHAASDGYEFTLGSRGDSRQEGRTVVVAFTDRPAGDTVAQSGLGFAVRDG